MSVEHKVSSDGRELRISVSGRFDFHTKSALQAAYENVDLKSARIVFDLGQCGYIDSSALGMLLLLREKAGGDQSSIELSQCQASTLKLLKMARCDEMFQVN